MALLLALRRRLRRGIAAFESWQKRREAVLASRVWRFQNDLRGALRHWRRYGRGAHLGTEAREGFAPAFEHFSGGVKPWTLCPGDARALGAAAREKAAARLRTHRRSREPRFPEQRAPAMLRAGLITLPGRARGPRRGFVGRGRGECDGLTCLLACLGLVSG